VARGRRSDRGNGEGGGAESEASILAREREKRQGYYRIITYHIPYRVTDDDDDDDDDDDH
jgi:hypothetical protein